VSNVLRACYKLNNVIIPDTVTSIGSNAFDGCTSLTEITLPAALTSIDGYAFYGCTALKEINIPDSVNSMGTYTFYNCTSLEKAHIPNIRKNLMDYTFYNCTSLKEINFPETLETIGNYAFYNCDALEKVVLPEKVNTINTYAFKDCDALTEVTIPSVKTIGTQAFYDCDALKTVTIGSANSIGSEAFRDCDVLASVDLGDYLGTLGASAFRKCPKLTTVTIPSPLVTIPDYAFADSVKLANVYIPDSVTSISSTAFSYPGVTTLHGGSGSAAQTYAATEDFDFEVTDNYVSVPLKAEKYANGEIKLIWDAVDGASKYSVAYLDTNSIYRTIADGITAAEYTLTDLTWSGTAKFVVRAYRNNRYSDYKTSDYLSIGSGLSNVGAISSVTDKSADTSLTLSWTSATNAKGYIVYLKNGETWEEIGRTASSVRQYVIEDLEKGKTYTFAVCGYYENGAVTVFGEKALVELTFTGMQLDVTGISILKAPTKTKYSIGEELDTTGGVIKVTYEDKSTGEINITSSMVTGYKSDTVGTQILTVTYCGFTDTFEVAVTEAFVAVPPTVTSITAGDGQVTLTWDAVDGATKYCVATYADGAYTVLNKTLKTTTYTPMSASGARPIPNISSARHRRLRQSQYRQLR